MKGVNHFLCQKREKKKKGDKQKFNNDAGRTTPKERRKREIAVGRGKGGKRGGTGGSGRGRALMPT